MREIVTVLWTLRTPNLKRKIAFIQTGIA